LSQSTAVRFAGTKELTMKYDCLFCDFTVVAESSEPAIKHLGKEHSIDADENDLQNYCLVVRYFSEDKE
jgi:hypothetical protein